MVAVTELPVCRQRMNSRFANSISGDVVAAAAVVVVVFGTLQKTGQRKKHWGPLAWPLSNAQMLFFRQNAVNYVLDGIIAFIGASCWTTRGTVFTFSLYFSLWCSPLNQRAILRRIFGVQILDVPRFRVKKCMVASVGWCALLWPLRTNCELTQQQCFQWIKRTRCPTMNGGYFIWIMQILNRNLTKYIYSDEEKTVNWQKERAPARKKGKDGFGHYCVPYYGDMFVDSI